MPYRIRPRSRSQRVLFWWRRNREGLGSTLFVILAIAFVVGGGIKTFQWKTDCEDHGGVYLKGAFSYECVVDGHVWKGEK